MPFANLNPKYHHNRDEMTNFMNYKNRGAKPVPKHNETIKGGKRATSTTDLVPNRYQPRPRTLPTSCHLIDHYHDMKMYPAKQKHKLDKTTKTDKLRILTGSHLVLGPPGKPQQHPVQLNPHIEIHHNSRRHRIKMGSPSRRGAKGDDFHFNFPTTIEKILPNLPAPSMY